MAKSKVEFAGGKATLLPKMSPQRASIPSITSVRATHHLLDGDRRPTRRRHACGHPARTTGLEARALGVGVHGNDLQINGAAKPEQVIVRPHVVVALTERDVEIKARSDVGNPFGQNSARSRSDDQASTRPAPFRLP